MSELEFTRSTSAESAGPPAAALLSIQHPDEILAHRAFSTDEKRAILAAWASDERAVLGEPTLRQLPSGAVVRFGDIRQALEALDRRPAWMGRPRSADPFRRRRGIGRWLSRRSRSPWDDDDPDPTCPAAARGPVVLSPAA